MVFVTGGTGFLGSHLIYHLLSKGIEVRALKRKESTFDLFSRVIAFYQKDPNEYLHKIEWVDGDILDIYSLEEALKGITDIYHTAAVVSFQPGEVKKMMHTNVAGTANLVNASLGKNIGKFCYVSSIAAIGRADNRSVIDEVVVWKASKRNSSYAVSKYAAEREVWRGIGEGLQAVIVNPSIIIGPGETESGTGKMISTVLNGLRFYSSGVNGFVDVRDVVNVMAQLMENDISGERFIVSAENISYKEIFSQIAVALNRPVPRYKAYNWMGSLIWRSEYLKSQLTRSKPLITQETAQTATNIYRYSNDKIVNLLDYSFIPIRESLKNACEYYLKML